MKLKYSISLQPFLKRIRLKTPISITYVFHPSRKWQDMNNAVSICDKFLQDALVDHGVIPDDNYENVILTTNMVWDKDKEWYIEVIIEEITSQ
jgi:Holliday junction resolvase RusA-like endonuclease